MGFRKALWCSLVVFCFFGIAPARVRHHSGGRQGSKFMKNLRRNTSQNTGLWPAVFNLATKAVISANATCGESGREEFCRMVEGGKGRCGVCDSFSSDPSRRHSIEYAIDGTSKWWQSPALYYGAEYEYVTIIIDLKQVYQITNIILKSANSPRPGSWALERSIDGINFSAWQYFARNDNECLERFGLTARKGKPHYYTDSEVICTSFYSRITPMENGEVHTSLVQGRPGVNETSPELLEFTKARYVRIRLMGLRGTVEPLPRWFAQDILKDKKLFYSIKDISIRGQCVCNGHAENCRHNVASGHPECECVHHTCGPHCDRCCPLYNQRQWSPGTSRDAHHCLPCNCHGHAESCHYDEEVDRAGLSADLQGNYQGGGVCDNCTDYTTGINCEKCLPGYYRPFGFSADAKAPCFKCDCDPAGSDNLCIQTGELAGACICLEGYTGVKCERCNAGFRGFPKCETCPCDLKGVINIDECEDECICKANVEGPYCDRCKLGYFGLRSDYPEGCASCFCSGVTNLCESAVLTPKKIHTMKDWLITDINVSMQVVPSVVEDTGFLSVGSYELSGFESYYWLAPEDFTGNKLESYSSYLDFKVQWVVMRGDTSGEPTAGPNIILVGDNGMKIAHGNDLFNNSSNMTFRIKMNEVGWYHLQGGIKDIVTRMKRTEYDGGSVSRFQFLSVLSDVRFVLLRASYHTDQIEALLEEATMNLGDIEEAESYSGVEKCSCPSGYSGLSCESCAFGYVRILPNASDPFQQSFCVKCDCNMHSESCRPDTGECFCLHNTVGEKCERCAVGYYGNPLQGTPEDCRRCACPLENDENNFSTSCQLDYFAEREEDEGGYVCTQCPKGYTGDHCEVCDDGFFGNPMEIGNSCQPCDCNGGPCNRTTGQCLSCKGNTEGWKCDRCKLGHYGNASMFNCQPCECDPIGSTSRQCDNVTGQCLCKDKFIGRICDKCETGYGNVTALCTKCFCNPIGSKSDICNPYTGLCDCQPGVEGFHCDACQSLHYGFSESGCQACLCDPDGSNFLECDANTGRCMCRPHYIGRTCSQCEHGYWKSPSKICIPCDCDPNGSKSQNEGCDQSTGQCNCKHGVGGQNCDRCLPNFFGNVTSGCKECEPCDKPGHVCNPNNGQCSCPPFTHGITCQDCVQDTWGYVPKIGCKKCNCSREGSETLSCHLLTGKCSCKLGFEGDKCDKCIEGFYGFPRCRKCNCDLRGALYCDKRFCSCDPNSGTCFCKDNVEGHLCNQCRPGYFGIDQSYEKGCRKCFCFGRSQECVNSNYVWDWIRVRNVTSQENNCLWSNQCIDLPPKFLGDLTTSYGGTLRIEGDGEFKQLQNRFRARLTGQNIVIFSDFEREVPLIETHWNTLTTYTKLPPECETMLTRECLMVILTNVTSIVIETNAEGIGEIMLNKAIESSEPLNPAISVEKCECPPQYSSPSCQKPGPGYFKDIDDTTGWIDPIIGVAKPCQCNGRSNTCDEMTGDCLNCSNNTAGSKCESCKAGYYKEAGEGCKACPCPSEDRNFAVDCRPNPKTNSFTCICSKGYSGPKCDQCEPGFYGNPTVSGGSCKNCNCNPYGSKGPSCDQITGDCVCRDGFTGIQCSQCTNPREYIESGVCVRCDNCTQMLFMRLDDIAAKLDEVNTQIDEGLGPPVQLLMDTNERFNVNFKQFNQQQKDLNLFESNANITVYEYKVEGINTSQLRLIRDLENATQETAVIQQDANILVPKVDMLKVDLDNFMNMLGNLSDTSDLKMALIQAESLLAQIKQLAIEVPKGGKVFQKCQNVFTAVNETYAAAQPNVELPKAQVNKLKEVLVQFGRDLENMENEAIMAAQRNNMNFQRIQKLQSDIVSLEGINQAKMKDNEIALQKLNATESILEDIQRIFENLENSELDVVVDTLDQKVELDSSEFPELDRLILKIKMHVELLGNLIGRLQSELNFTPEEIEKINATEAYENIIKSLVDSRRVAQEAQTILEMALDKLYPEQNDTIIDRANLLAAFSDRLEKRITNLGTIDPKYAEVKNEVENLKSMLFMNGRDNNYLTQMLQSIKESIEADSALPLQKARNAAFKVMEHMEDILNNVTNLKYLSKNGLFKQFEKYKKQASPQEMERLNTLVKQQRLELRNTPAIPILSKRLAATTTRVNSFARNISEMTEKLNQLRNKIKYAFQVANNIDIPLDISTCQRTFQAPEATIFNNLKIDFACMACKLFDLKSKSGEILIFKNESGVTIKWDDIDEKLLPTDKNENILVMERLGKIINIRLGEDEYSFMPKDVFYITKNSTIEVAGRDGQNNTIQNIILNDVNIGLWNFVKAQNECAGAIRKNQEVSRFFFNGEEGYTIFNASAYDPKRIHLKVNFWTFDNDSLIFMAQERDDTCAYLALSLVDGQLKFEGPIGTILTKGRRFNTGNITTVEIDLYQQRGAKISYALTVNDMQEDDWTVTRTNFTAKDLFRIRPSNYYWGGVPPIFNSTCVDTPINSFFGYIDLREIRLPIVASHGTLPTVVRPGRVPLHFKQAWFPERGGYLKLDPKIEFGESFNMSFEMDARRPDCVVMKIPELIEIRVNKDFHLEAEFAAGDTIVEDEKVRNGIHMVEISITPNQATLNGQMGIVSGLPEGDVVIELGNVEKPGFASFHGGISMIVIDDRPIYMDANTVIEFSRVQIGKYQYEKGKDNIMMKSLKPPSRLSDSGMQNTQECFAANSYSTLDGAIKFGDKVSSYVKIENSFWKKDYILEVDFRTVYPDGVILISVGPQSQNRHYNILEVKNRMVQFTMKGKRKKEFAFDKAVNDGKWHTIKITHKGLKRKRRLIISLDGESLKPMRPPRNNVRQELYFGNVPHVSPYKSLALAQFRGCMKSAKINGEAQFLQKKSISSNNNVGSCFPKIESGAYFGGDAYAIYSKDFPLTSAMELTFEFRTAELNGILLSVSSYGNSPALSIELQNGAVVMTIDIGNNIVSEVNNNLGSEFAICDNKWHRVTALYSGSELTLNVDGIRKIWVQADTNFALGTTELPLYIGGLPDSAPVGTLKTRENFKGCIKNLKVENKIKDWTDMEKLKNVLLNCPVP